MGLLLLVASCLSLNAQVPFLQGKGIKTRLIFKGQDLMLEGGTTYEF